MNEDAKKLWQSEAGASLFRNALKKQPLTLQDRITLRKLREINKTTSQPLPTEPSPTDKP